MAVQGKGIIGAPRGKIGNVQFYESQGQSVVKSISYPVDSFLRRWNLLGFEFQTRLAIYWTYLTVTEQNEWAALAPPGETGFEHFQHLALDLAFSHQDDNLSGSLFHIHLFDHLERIHVQGSWRNNQIVVDIPEDSPYWQHPGNSVIRYEMYHGQGASDRFEVNYGNINYQPLVFDIPQPVDPAWQFIVIEPRKKGPTLVYDHLLTDIYAPDLSPAP